MRKGKKTQPFPFTLYSVSEKKLVFEATYRVYHQDGFLAMYHDYPAAQTEILLCRQLSKEQLKEYENDLCELIHAYPGEESRSCGYFVPFQTVHTAEQAVQTIQAEANGTRLIRDALLQMGGG